MNNVISNIKEKYNSLTPAQKAIADKILNDPDILEYGTTTYLYQLLHLKQL